MCGREAKTEGVRARGMARMKDTRAVTVFVVLVLGRKDIKPVPLSPDKNGRLVLGSILSTVCHMLWPGTIYDIFGYAFNPGNLHKFRNVMMEVGRSKVSVVANDQNWNDI